jgi:hypothetical protein
VALGALFAVSAYGLRSRGRIVVAALVFAGVEPAFAIWMVLHSVLPHDTFQIFLTAIPLWASILGHLTYGTVRTLMIIAYMRAQDRRPYSAGTTLTR